VVVVEHWSNLTGYLTGVHELGTAVLVVITIIIVAVMLLQQQLLLSYSQVTVEDHLL